MATTLGLTSGIHHVLPQKPTFDVTSSSNVSDAVGGNDMLTSDEDNSTLESLTYAFSIPFSFIPGPDPDQIILATSQARERWLHPPDSPPNLPTSRLPVHQKSINDVRELCKRLSPGLVARTTVSVTELTAETALRKKQTTSVGLWIAGEPAEVHKTRGLILQSVPVAMRNSCVNIDHDQYYLSDGVPNTRITVHLERIAQFTGTDIFVLKPPEPTSIVAVDQGSEASQNRRLKISIFGDYESVEHAKTRVLIMIDDLLGQEVIPTFMELSVQSMICGRGRKNVKLIESATRTAIYFPPPFPQVYGYSPPGGTRRDPDQIFITGSSREDIAKAERMLLNLTLGMRIFVKDVSITLTKIDYILLQRLDDVKKIMDANGTFVQLPVLGSPASLIRVQGSETLHLERTIKAIMVICGQFYNASWWVMDSPIARLLPKALEVQKLLIDVAAFTGVSIAFNKQVFEFSGSDENVKAAMHMLSDVPFNGKINKIMSQSNIQIIFDTFNEYNFFIDVCGGKFDTTMLGLKLVEQELPAAVSFHVPDSYHKRIIGIGGQHIQRIMKKYSVFVKFSNAMERGASGRSESDGTKVDNVICRTPARNAANLELVKSEIMGMVQRADADIVQEHVDIPRLLHQMASDIVTIKGPQWQVPHAVHEFLALVPETHIIRLKNSPELEELLKQDEFKKNITDRMNTQFGIRLHPTVDNATESPGGRRSGDGEDYMEITFTYTRNNAGALRDAIEMLTNFLLSHGIQTDSIKGALPRPKSDSFEDFVPFFHSAVFQKPSQSRVGSSNGSIRRLSGDAGSIFGDQVLHTEPAQFTDTTEAAFYDGDRKASLSDAGLVRPPGSSGSISSTRTSFSLGRKGSTVWEGGLEATGLPDGEEWTKLESDRSRSNSVTM
ncbi:unnamed protein product [Tuber melanosporum]|uniref:(Perigord truffle) hypothetical protein n=1 Tax=Tuber melanosporum (strain Mel28) TaxID=656061 RepID=D5GCF0_TUBMM|nr:uncharacterized protein GSTUM_00005858001 [Tuber melanosporum]CAZ82193.1 unnamed protein product [Tuber melanosporum]